VLSGRTARRSGKGVSEEYTTVQCVTQKSRIILSQTITLHSCLSTFRVVVKFLFFENSHRTKVHHMSHMSNPNRTLVPTLLYILALLCQSDYYLHTDDIFRERERGSRPARRVCVMEREKEGERFRGRQQDGENKQESARRKRYTRALCLRVCLCI